MDSKESKAKGITEEEFRSAYPDVSIQHLSDKAFKVTPHTMEKRQPIKTPTKATIVPKTPPARSPAVARAQNIKTPPQNVGVKGNLPAQKANIPIAASPKTPVTVKPQVVKTPVLPKPQAAPKTPLATKPSAAVKTPTVQSPMTKAAPASVKAAALAKAQAAQAQAQAALKAAQQAKQTPTKAAHNVPKQQTPVAKTPAKPISATAAAKNKSPDQSTMTVLYQMPTQNTPQRSNQVSIEKIEQQQRIPVVLDTNNQVVLRQVINSGQLVVQNRVAPVETTLQSVVIGTSGQTTTPVVAPQVEITTSEPLQALQVTQQVTLFRPKGNTFTVDDVKNQISLNKQNTMTNVVSSTTNSIPAPVPIPTQPVQPEQQKKVSLPAREQGSVTHSPLRQSNRVTSNNARPQQKPAARNYQSTQGQVKKVSPKREIPMQKVSPMQPPPPPPPELQFANEEEVTTSEALAPKATNDTQVIVILPNGEQKQIAITSDMSLDCSIQELLQRVNVTIPDGCNNAQICDPRAPESYEDQEGADGQWENSENIVPEQGEILGLHDEMGSRSINGESAGGRAQRESDEVQKDADAAKSRKTKAENHTGDVPKKKKVCKRRRAEEPVCLTISDDEELLGLAAHHAHAVEEGFHSDSNSQMSSCDKEPVITDEMINELKQQNISALLTGGGVDVEEHLLDNPNPEEQTFLQCRTVRIGSYKVVPKDKVVITPHGLKVTVPILNSDHQYVELKIMYHEIIKVLIHFGRQMPVLFFYTKPTAAAKIRKALKMTDKNGFYYDTTSSDETHKRITFLPDKIDEDCKTTLKSIFGNPEFNVFAELTGKEANDILVKASPKEVQAFILKKQPSNQPPQPFDGTNIQTIMVYPPPPEKGGIPINTEDYACLGEDQFLNDVIIDFYLKYVVEKTLSPEDRARTHVFSSFFYKRLTTKPPAKRKSIMNPVEVDPNASPAMKRHSRVKSWTKNVNLFAKDFIVIPINESSHWFLAIICFPGLTGPVRFLDNKPIEMPGRKKKKKDGKHTVTIGSTTITAVTPSMTTLDVGDDGEDRDEADGEDEDMDVPDSDEDHIQKPDIKVEPETEGMTTRNKSREPIKQPCILIFDSLAGASRARVVATLRDYLRVEYEVKNGESRDFSGDVMKGVNLRCPQQTNYTDCGLYVLQYVEAFFQWPITDYRIPITQLQDWFQADIVSRKRYEIQQLLHRLMQEQNIDIEALNLPLLNLRPDGKHMDDYSGSEEEDEDEEEDDEQMCEEEEEDEMFDDGDYNEDMGHDENQEMELGEIGHHDDEEDDEDPDNYLDPNLEHEDHEMDDEEYGMEEDEDDQRHLHEDDMEDKEELDDISLSPVHSVKGKDLKNYRIPRLVEKRNMGDSV